MLECTEQVAPTFPSLAVLLNSGPYAIIIIAAVSAIVGIAFLVLILKCIIAVCLKIFVPRRLKKSLQTEVNHTYVNKDSDRGSFTSELYYNVIGSKPDKRVQAYNIPPRTLEDGEESNHNYYVGMQPVKKNPEYVVSSINSDIEQSCYSSIQASKQYDYARPYNPRAKHSAPCDSPNKDSNYEQVYPAAI